MNHQSKFNQHTPQQAQDLQHTDSQQAAREFASAEDLLRHDASQVELPPTILTRLIDSISKEPKHSWWRRWLSRDSPEP